MNAVPLARILIVDDDAAQVRALRDILRDQGYETAGFTVRISICNGIMSLS